LFSCSYNVDINSRIVHRAYMMLIATSVCFFIPTFEKKLRKLENCWWYCLRNDITIIHILSISKCLYPSTSRFPYAIACSLFLTYLITPCTFEPVVKLPKCLRSGGNRSKFIE
jgi:hypothetical protein